MAKSIRSKIKRKHRAEFRSTIGEAAYQANMSKVQQKLKESVDKQSFKSLEKLSDCLATDDNAMQDADDSDGSPAMIDAAETRATDIRGENKAPVSKKSKKRKHKITRKADGKRKPSSDSKPRPRFFCQF